MGQCAKLNTYADVNNNKHFMRSDSIQKRMDYSENFLGHGLNGLVRCLNFFIGEQATDGDA